MNAADLIRSDFEDELNSTRKILAAVPDDKMDFQPHAKSMKLGRLAGHVADLLQWTAVAVDDDKFDVAPGGKPAFAPFNPTSGKELLEHFDKNVATAREKLASLDGDRLEDKWSLYRDGKFMFDMPRWKVLMGFNLAHIVHHRAQLGVYLRLNGIAVPGVYGPSQDDKDAMAK
jgi:uncharacterized damage-inducible protein DinB